MFIGLPDAGRAASSRRLVGRTGGKMPPSLATKMVATTFSDKLFKAKLIAQAACD
jgi:hypothetical protein